MRVVEFKILLCLQMMPFISSDFTLTTNEDAVSGPDKTNHANPPPISNPNTGPVKDEYHPLREDLYAAAKNDPCSRLHSKSTLAEIREANRLCGVTLEKFKGLPKEETKNCQEPKNPQCVPHKEKRGRKWRTVYDCCYEVIFKAFEGSIPTKPFKSPIRDCFANIKWDSFFFGPRPFAASPDLSRKLSRRSVTLSDRMWMLILCIKSPKKDAIYNDPVFEGRIGMIGKHSFSSKSSRITENDRL
ncbi:unnamed protein product [Bemisia tabaci]|uniref:Uncharacterized protein n=1 Tax=Bemisia tabaci TaxID=7038 RepID=A0A9P0CBV0_BEMTA|nr:unnamed protein product [Bemisia tabaci]